MKVFLHVLRERTVLLGTFDAQNPALEIVHQQSLRAYLA